MGMLSLKVDRESKRNTGSGKQDMPPPQAEAQDGDSDDSLSETRPWSEDEDTIEEVTIPVATRPQASYLPSKKKKQGRALCPKPTCQKGFQLARGLHTKCIHCDKLWHKRCIPNRKSVDQFICPSCSRPSRVNHTENGN